MANEWKNLPLFPDYHGDLIENLNRVPKSLAYSCVEEAEYYRRANIVNEIVRLVNLPKLIEVLRTAGLSEEKITEIASQSHICAPKNS
jgi:hypothetical protein